MTKCLNCGYERQGKDDLYGIIPSTECPKCHAIYEKVERWLLKKEYEKAEKWLAEKEGQSRDGSLSDMEGSQESNDGSVKGEWNYYNQGCNALDAGYYEDAIEKFTEVIQREPSHANAIANRGIAYRKLKRNIEATADLKKAELLGSAVAKDYLQKIRRNRFILGTVAAIAAFMIVNEWQDNNEKVKREEMQRQQAIVAEQARIKAEQERSAFQEEYMREFEKKMIHDMVYGRPRSSDPRSFWDNPVTRQRQSSLDDPMTRMEMEDMARKVSDLESKLRREKSEKDDLESKLRREKSDRQRDKMMKGQY